MKRRWKVDCDECRYKSEDGTCGAFECYGRDCPELPCEIEGEIDE